jgi:hypothetical protein
VALWDHQLRANQGRASALADNVHRLYERQEQLRRACDDIEAYQEDLEADLATIEVRIYTQTDRPTHARRC